MEKRSQKEGMLVFLLPRLNRMRFLFLFTLCAIYLLAPSPLASALEEQDCPDSINLNINEDVCPDPPVEPPAEPPTEPPVDPPVEPPVEPDRPKPDKPKPDKPKPNKPNKPKPNKPNKPKPEREKKEKKSEEKSTTSFLKSGESALDINVDNLFFLDEAMLSRQAIRSFDIPPFLLPIYQSCGSQYGIPWQILAAINSIETNFGRNLNVSSAGARGWMQFMPETWKAYGKDANRDGKADPYNPLDAICSAANYLRASGFSDDIRGAIFAYNRADWYVEDVLKRARKYYRMPFDLISSIATLASAPFSPMSGKFKKEKRADKKGIFFQKKEEARVTVAIDSTVKKRGFSKKLGHYLVLRDSSGNSYLYANLKEKFKAEKAKKRGKRERRKGILLAGESIGKTDTLFFSIKPAGKDSPWINPGSFLKGWRIMEKIAFASFAKKNPPRPSAAQILLLSRERLTDLVLEDKTLLISSCDKEYIRKGLIDRRVLALLAWLSRADFRLTISSMLCGRESSITVSGNRSYHSFGQAIDIAAINGESVFGNQKRGSLTEALVRQVMELQGPMRPAELISLFDFGPPSWADPSGHDDHVHVGYGDSRTGKIRTIKKNQWQEITDHLGKINLPKISKSSIVKGKVSYFGGDGDLQEVAGGGMSNRPGLALNLRPGSDSGWNNAQTQRWMRWSREGRPMLALVKTQGKEAILPIIDLGPAGWTNRAIDITKAGVVAMGLNPSTFKTDAPGRVILLGRARGKG
jgi:hypothetical protein